MASDPYTTLGVARGAGEAEIKKAYRKLAKELHPDRNKDNQAASDRFSRVTAAYDLLSDADKRARFDRGEIDGDGNPASPFGFGGGGTGGGGRAGGFEFNAGGGDFGDIFDGLFKRGGGSPFGGGGASPFGAGARAAPPKGANVGYRLGVAFEDAATGKPQRVTLADGKTIDLKIPAGVESGTQMRLSGKGEPGMAGAGDAIVTIEVEPHAQYRREGDTIRLDLGVSLADAVLGASVRVPTVDGPVMLTVPPGSSSGRVLRLRGKGWTTKGGTRGDQLVTLMIEVPPDDAGLQAWAESVRAAPGVER